MKFPLLLAASALLASTANAAVPPHTKAKPPAKTAAATKLDTASPVRQFFKPSEVPSTGTLTVAGQPIPYDAVAGTLIIHPKDWEDTDAVEADADKSGDKSGDKAQPKPEASMFYTAYFKQGVPAAGRPITFLFNGGPGSSTVWLRMGAFGPVRIVTADTRHTPAPYTVVDNDQSLLDVSDLVFIDAPGTGFSRIAGKEKEKSFYGVDQDIDAFTRFITQFLTKYGRWSSPKYIFGESYGTMRGAGLSLALQRADVDLNGVILLSNILNWDFMPDDPQVNPGIDMPYIAALPTYAATAYHFKKVQWSAGLQSFLSQVERFATTDYAAALIQGNDLPDAERQRVARQLSAYTGLSIPYLLKTNLRIEYGAFQKELLGEQGLTTGTLDTRFVGATLDPLSKTSSYDPQDAAISAAYVAAWNNYVRDRLHYTPDIAYKSGIPIYSKWDYKHQPPSADKPLIALPNVLPDLATAMMQNPDMKVMVNGGYFDVSTPYFEGKMEMRHLPVPPALRGNVECHYYEAGHMVYLQPEVLAQLRTNVADFIRRTSGVR